jgi:dUTP pyrophosphatase
MDLRAAIDAEAPVSIAPGGRLAVPTGLIMEIPQGFEGQIRPRSGLALKSGVTCLNTPGTVDSDYRGEIMVILANLGGETFTVTRGMRIAQMVIAPVVQVRIEVVQELSATERGSGGFGSTGVA